MITFLYFSPHYNNVHGLCKHLQSIIKDEEKIDSYNLNIPIMSR